MLHIKMFISNAVQKIIQTNRNGRFAGHLQIKQATNSLISVQHSKWARSVNSPYMVWYGMIWVWLWYGYGIAMVLLWYCYGMDWYGMAGENYHW